ncbi:gp216 [Sphingomonas phage PAU]|uniref:gp216 n=1 Tax=Sphingomonas phage PAU TaxID=1150991 RepID=UPI0002573376|nr:gp216 [Sphingomonas phage PAU]AFF28214.1 gp216 [Sphingomonas phage PAU]
MKFKGTDQKTSRLIFTDFDGIFSHDMQYSYIDRTSNGPEKNAKTVAFGIRDVVKILNYAGFEIHIVSGDSTEKGQALTKKFLHNIHVESVNFVPTDQKLDRILELANGRDFIWIGEDLIDLQIKEFAMNYITTDNAPNMLKELADANFRQDYFWHDLLSYLMKTKIFNVVDEDTHCLIKYALQKYIKPDFFKLVSYGLIDKNYLIESLETYRGVEELNEIKVNDIEDFMDKIKTTEVLKTVPVFGKLDLISSMKVLVNNICKHELKFVYTKNVHLFSDTVNIGDIFEVLSSLRFTESSNSFHDYYIYGFTKIVEGKIENMLNEKLGAKF